MADYIVTSGELTTVANAIREKNGTSSSLSWPNGFVSGISSGGGGGGQATVLFDGNVTTEAQQIGEPTGTIEGLTEITADTIKVTFNGTEYTCQKTEDGYGDRTFTEYPFIIDSWQGSVMLHTQTAGTYSLKIEEPQSGGSSDFSTANVTVINNLDDLSVVNAIVVTNDIMNDIGALIAGTNNMTAVLYKNTARWMISTGTVTATGDATVESGRFGSEVTITGDCTITISDGDIPK